MLTELSDARLESGNRSRRWFADTNMDLTVWYEADGAIAGFQLCFDRLHAEHALTWWSRTGHSVHAVDDGENRPGRPKASPILTPDGDARICSVLLAEFQQRAVEIDCQVAHFVEFRLREVSGL